VSSPSASVRGDLRDGRGWTCCRQMASKRSGVRISLAPLSRCLGRSEAYEALGRRLRQGNDLAAFAVTICYSRWSGGCRDSLRVSWMLSAGSSSWPVSAFPA
jgi:hypothetical protein